MNRRLAYAVAALGVAGVMAAVAWPGGADRGARIYAAAVIVGGVAAAVGLRLAWSPRHQTSRFDPSWGYRAPARWVPRDLDDLLVAVHQATEVEGRLRASLTTSAAHRLANRGLDLENPGHRHEIQRLVSPALFAVIDPARRYQRRPSGVPASALPNLVGELERL